jgi:putative ABC transport system ATP-binding protein
LGNELHHPFLRVDRVSKTYGEGPSRTDVLSAASFDVVRGDTVALTGVSGSGKSTLISLMAGLMIPDSGAIHLDGQDITLLDDPERARLRAARVGVVLQSGNLIPFLTALENVQLAIAISGNRKSVARARHLLLELGLGARLDHLPQRMSGGETQRVAVAVALANDPDLLLADEITGELDSQSSDEVMGMVFDASRDRKLTTLFVTHDEALAARAHHHLRLVNGKLQQV